MTAVMKYAGAIAFEDLEAEVQRAFQRNRTPDAAPVSTPVRVKAPTGAGTASAAAALNFAGLGLFAAAWTQGWIDPAALAGRPGLAASIGAIVTVFTVGLVFGSLKIWRIGRETRALRSEAPPAGSWAGAYLDVVRSRDAGARGIAAAMLQLRLATWCGGTRHFATSVALLGVIGSLIGMIGALAGADPFGPGAIRPEVPPLPVLFRDLSVALYAAAAGAITHLWLTANHRMLTGATTRLAAEIVERGECAADV